MLSSLLGGSEKKAKKEAGQDRAIKEARDLFNIGRFPVVTTQIIENRPIAKVLGLVCCRGFDSEEAFFGMAAMAVKKGAQGIIGYNENVAFHPDGSKYFSCFGTAVMFQREGRSDLLSDKKTVKDTLRQIPNAPSPRMQEAESPEEMASAYDELDSLSLSPKAPAQKTVKKTADDNFVNTEAKQSVADLAARMAAEEAEEIAQTQAPQGRIAQPTEEEDPVLQRLLASQKRQASAWQQ